ncbi:MAG: LysM peptidoglycan-binding domain-containing protein [Armatimonadota bacterium]
MLRWRGRSYRLLLQSALIVSLALLVACGDDDDDGGEAQEIDSRAVPTASPPAEPPPLLIVGRDFQPGEGSLTTIGGRRHTVAEGESPNAIAEQYGISVEELLAANNLEEGAVLSVGQVLVIPSPTVIGGGEEDVATEGDETTTATATPPADEEPTEEADDTSGSDVYIVQAGDNPSTIAAQYGISVEELAAANGMSVEEISQLSVGQELVIP